MSGLITLLDPWWVVVVGTVGVSTTRFGIPRCGILGLAGGIRGGWSGWGAPFLIIMDINSIKVGGLQSIYLGSSRSYIGFFVVVKD